MKRLILQICFIVFHLQLTILQIAISQSEDTTIDCQVQVSEPWPAPFVFIPRDSITEMSCTSLVQTKSPTLSIDLASIEGSFQYRFGSQDDAGDDVILHTDGLFKIEEPGTPTLVRLLINNTAVNNQTVIYCNRGRGAPVTATIFVFNPSAISLNTLDIGVNYITLEWSQEPLASDAVQSFSLTVSRGSSSQLENISGVNESYYRFTAPEGASPCEVYNFSVTATYVGATYTGAGCSVPSPVLSTMLPSLPNISRLESSLNYMLQKQSTAFVIEVSFEPASYCENYPVVNYTLEVNSSLNREILASVLEPNADRFTLGGNLSNDTLYTFRVVVANNVETILTSDRHFYTTDVQMVMVTLIEGVNASTIQCEFIPGSNAIGCMVVLTGFVPYHVNLTRNPSTNLTTSTVTLEHPPSCYTGVEAFDIESDGSVGSLAVPGQLGGRSEIPCAPVQTSPVNPKATQPLSNLTVMILVITIAVVVAVVIILIAIIVIIILVRKCKSSQVGTTDTYSKFGCPAALCCRQSSADGDEHHQIQLQSLKQLTDKTTPDKDKKWTECVCADTSAKNHPGEVATTAKGESLYSEVVPSNKRKKCASTNSADVKADNAYSEPKRAPTKGYTSLLLAGGQGDTGALSQEALYDQPIPVKVKTPAGRADKNRNDSSTANCEGTHATQETHLYFTLEPGRATGRINSTPTSLQAPPNISDPPQPASSECPPPIYQEITDLKTRGQATTSTVSGAGSIPNTPLPSSSPPLIQRPLSVPATDSDTQNPVG